MDLETRMTIQYSTLFVICSVLIMYDAARFGHNAHMRVSRDTTSNTFSYRMYIVGGFNGELLNDVLVYEPG